MNKTELIAASAEKAGLSKKDTERVINAAIDTIVAELAKGERVQLSGFGIFEAKERDARVGRNPRTKETIQMVIQDHRNVSPHLALQGRYKH